MKFSIPLTLLFVLIVTKSFSQTGTPVNKMIYLDSTWTESTKDNCKYIRVVEGYYSDKQLYVFKDYYKSEALKMIGSSTDKDVLKGEGQFVYYYENGKKKSTVTYLNSKKSGREFNWYENGDIKSELEYYTTKDNLVDYKLNNYWNSQKEQKVISGNGDLEYADEYIEENGKVKNGLRDGIWKGKNLKLKSTFTENHENGKLISGVSIDSLNIEHPYTVLNKAPEPVKGIKSFYNYFGKAMVIPVEARNKVSGKIYMTFIVDTDGNLVEPKIVKGLGYGLDENAILAIKNAKKWIPGTKRGIPVRAHYSLPITIATKNGL